MKFKPTNKSGGIVVEMGPQESQLPPQPSTALATPRPLFRLKKILVPVDFSELSKKALQYAIPLARQFDAELSLVHVVRAYPPTPEMAPVDIESIQDAKKELAALREMIGEDVPCEMHVRTGEPYAEIVTAAKASGSDLVILATHGRSGLSRVLLGSTAEKVLRHAACPILVVREHEQDFVTSNAVGHETGAMA